MISLLASSKIIISVIQSQSSISAINDSDFKKMVQKEHILSMKNFSTNLTN